MLFRSSMIYQVDGSPTDKFKNRLYNIDYRPKIIVEFDKNFYKKINLLYDKPILENKKKFKIPKDCHIFGHRNEFIKMMETWNYY